MLNILLQVSALHYSAGSWELEGFRTVTSAHALHQPTIVGLSISSQHPQVWNLIRTEHSLKRREHRIKNKAC